MESASERRFPAKPSPHATTSAADTAAIASTHAAYRHSYSLPPMHHHRSSVHPLHHHHPTYHQLPPQQVHPPQLPYHYSRDSNIRARTLLLNGESAPAPRGVQPRVQLGSDEFVPPSTSTTATTNRRHDPWFDDYTGIDRCMISVNNASEALIPPSDSYRLLLHHKKLNRELRRLQQQTGAQSVSPNTALEKTEEEPVSESHYTELERTDDEEQGEEAIPEEAPSEDDSSEEKPRSISEKSTPDDSLIDQESTSPSNDPPAKRRRLSTTDVAPHEDGKNDIPQTRRIVPFRDSDEDKMNKRYFYVGNTILEAMSLTDLYKGVDQSKFAHDEKYIKCKRQSVTNGLHFVCKYCQANNNAHVHMMSSVFSTNRIWGIYRRFPSFIKNHILSGACKSVPEDVKKKVIDLESAKWVRAKIQKRFEACIRANGFRDLPADGGVYHSFDLVDPED